MYEEERQVVVVRRYARGEAEQILCGTEGHTFQCMLHLTGDDECTKCGLTDECDHKVVVPTLEDLQAALKASQILKRGGRRTSKEIRR